MRRVTAVVVAMVALMASHGRAAPPPLTVTAEERARIQAHGPVTYCVDPDWPPFETIDANGQHQGIAADLLRLAAQRAGLSLALLVTRNWSQSIARSRAGDCTLLSFLNQSPEREAWLTFTRPLFTDRNVVVTREDQPMVPDLAALGDATIALPRGTFIEEMVRRDFPRLRVLLTETEDETFFLVSNHQADLTIRSMLVAVHTIKTQGWFNLKVAGQVPGYENQLRIGIATDHAWLRPILDRAVATITPAEQTAIANRHVAITVQYGVDYALIAKIVGGFSIALLTSLAWLVKVRAMNRRLKRAATTDPLTGLANRAALNHHLTQAESRFHRLGTPFALILADLDHFKQVNDDFGHQTGDRVLQGFAAIAVDAVRADDLVGRWGGEEFLIVCDGADIGPAVIVAERLAQRMRDHDFATGRPHTISVGVATFGPGDTVDSLLARTDEALYQAKNQGRDRIHLAAPPPPEDRR